MEALMVMSTQKRHDHRKTDFFPDKHSLGVIPNLRLKAAAKCAGLE